MDAAITERQQNLSLLGLSKKAAGVLLALRSGADTPLLLSRATKVSRPAIYAILLNLKKRGIAESRIHAGRKFWKLVDRRELEQKFFETKRDLLQISPGTQEVFGIDDAVAIIHREKDTVRKLLGELMFDHKNERLFAFVGDNAAVNWNTVFSASETNAFNRAVKKNNIITEGVLPIGWFERQTKELGIEWAKDFEGRSAKTHVIAHEYFRHGAQLFVFKNSVYLIALGEELIIEIRHSEIQKMLLSMFRFIEDNSRLIDVNALLRKLIEETKEPPLRRTKDV